MQNKNPSFLYLHLQYMYIYINSNATEKNMLMNINYYKELIHFDIILFSIFFILDSIHIANFSVSFIYI